MATTYTAAIGVFCNQALKLLRQDASISNFTATPVAVKCGDLYEIAFDAVATPLGLNSAPTDAADKRALVYALAKELALPVTGRVSDYEAMAFGFRNALADAVRKKIETTITTGTPELAALYRAYAGKEEDLPATYTVYSKRITAIQADSTATVKALLGITGTSALTGIAKEASIALTVAKLAQACGYGADFVQLKMQEHGSLVAEYRRNELKTNAEGNASSPTGMLLAAVNEVKDLLGISSGTLSELALGAARCLVYVRHGEKYGYDADFVQGKAKEYETLVAEWRRKELDSQAESGEGSGTPHARLAAAMGEVRSTLGLASNATLSGLGLGAAQALLYVRYGAKMGYDTAFVEEKHQEYLAKLKAAFAETASGISATNPASNDTSDMASCIREVRKTLAIADSEALDGLALGAVQALYYARYGERAGYEANFTEAKTLVYKSKLLEWRKVKLSEAAQTDPVLLAVLPSLSENEAALANGYAVYSAKRATVEDAAAAEINAAHGWATAFAVTGTTTRVYPTTHPAYPAFLYLCATRLAPACGAGPELAAMIAKKYAAALEEAKAKDIAASMASETDADLLEAFGLVRRYVLADGAVPWGWAELKAAYERARESARLYVMEWYGWSAFRREREVASVPRLDGTWTTSALPDEGRVVAYLDFNGRDVPAEAAGDEIVSTRPIKRIVVQDGEAPVSEWPATLRRAYVATLAESLALSMPTGESSRRFAALSAYRDGLLETARAADSRRSRPTYATAVTQNRYTRSARGEGLRFPPTEGGFRHG